MCYIFLTYNGTEYHSHSKREKWRHSEERLDQGKTEAPTGQTSNPEALSQMIATSISNDWDSPIPVTSHTSLFLITFNPCRLLASPCRMSHCLGISTSCGLKMQPRQAIAKFIILRCVIFTYALDNFFQQCKDLWHSFMLHFF